MATIQQQPKKLAGSYAAECGLFIAISALLCLGGVMVFSAGASLDQKIDLSQFWKYATVRRVAFVPIVWGVLLIGSRLNYRKWLVSEKSLLRSPISWITALSVVMLVAVLIPGIGQEVNYSMRWLKIGPAQYGIQFQPSELAKWSVVIFLAAYCRYNAERIRQFWRGFVPACVALLVVVGLIGKEDFGTAVLVGAVGAMVLIAGGIRWRHLLILIPIAAVAFYLLVYCNDYRWERMQAYFDSHSSERAQSSGYQANQSIMALGAGGIWGVGLGNGTVKYGWLPEDTTDFIFAVIGEELGFAGCAIVVALFIIIMICSLSIIRRAQDSLARLVAFGIAATIGAQTAMNLLVVTGLAPTKGIALPFVSAGGSGLLMAALAASVLMNIARQNEKWEKSRKNLLIYNYENRK